MMRLFVVTGLVLAASGLFAQDTTALPERNVWFSDAAGKHFTCPAEQMKMVAGEATPYVDHHGGRYYVCGPACAERFGKAPDSLAAALIIPAGVIAVSGGKIMVNCPVSGERVAVNETTPHQDYSGHGYNFCCNKCLKKFAADPVRYSAVVKVGTH